MRNNSPSRHGTVKVGNSVFVVKHVAPKELPLGNPGSTLVFQALRHLGKNAVNEEVVSRLRRAVATLPDRQKLLEDSRYTTDWIADIVRLVAAEQSEEDVIHG